jgi:hypothetical protein
MTGFLPLRTLWVKCSDGSGHQAVGTTRGTRRDYMAVRPGIQFIERELDCANAVDEQGTAAWGLKICERIAPTVGFLSQVGGPD